MTFFTKGNTFTMADTSLLGVIVGLISVAAGYWFWNDGNGSQAWQTMFFTMLTFCQMACPVRSKTAAIVVFLLLVLQSHAFSRCKCYVDLAADYHLCSSYNLVFRTFPLQWEELAVCAAGAVTIIFITEVKKLFLRKKQDFITA
jgi:P-type Ca2+ transporter type 2C